MKILVTIKEVADLADTFSIEGVHISEQDLEYGLNEWDDYALEEAVQLSEANDDVEVVAVSIGPERAEETIRKTLAKGADRSIRIWDDALEDVDHIPATNLARMLSEVVEEESPDLVLTGVQSADDANGSTGVALASYLGYEWAAVVNQLDIDPTADSATVHRELEGGVEAIVNIELPAVLTIQTGINEPRYASLRGIRQAQRKPIEIRSLDELGLDEAVVSSPITLVDLYEPEVESEATIWEGDAEETAGELATFLREKGVVDA